MSHARHESISIEKGVILIKWLHKNLFCFPSVGTSTENRLSVSNDWLEQYVYIAMQNCWRLIESDRKKRCRTNSDTIYLNRESCRSKHQKNGIHGEMLLSGKLVLMLVPKIMRQCETKEVLNLIKTKLRLHCSHISIFSVCLSLWSYDQNALALAGAWKMYLDDIFYRTRLLHDRAWKNAETSNDTTPRLHFIHSKCM